MCLLSSLSSPALLSSLPLSSPLPEVSGRTSICIFMKTSGSGPARLGSAHLKVTLGRRQWHLAQLHSFPVVRVSRHNNHNAFSRDSEKYGISSRCRFDDSTSKWGPLFDHLFLMARYTATLWLTNHARHDRLAALLPQVPHLNLAPSMRRDFTHLPIPRGAFEFDSVRVLWLSLFYGNRHRNNYSPIAGGLSIPIVFSDRRRISYAFPD